MRVLKFAISPLLAVAGAFKGPKAQQQPAPIPVATRDDARDAAEKQLELARRRGGAADIATGAYGAEAGAGGKTTLGS